MTDITSRPDIERLVDTFYGLVRGDDLLGPIFDDVAHVDWAEHLPKMYAFWDAVLFGTPGFKGNPLATHVMLSRKTALTEREFGRWITLFHQTVDQEFAGPMAIEAKRRAEQIAMTMQYHVNAR